MLGQLFSFLSTSIPESSHVTIANRLKVIKTVGPAVNHANSVRSQSVSVHLVTSSEESRYAMFAGIAASPKNAITFHNQ